VLGLYDPAHVVDVLHHLRPRADRAVEVLNASRDAFISPPAGASRALQSIVYDLAPDHDLACTRTSGAHCASQHTN
jgi:hypothetical protein